MSTRIVLGFLTIIFSFPAWAIRSFHMDIGQDAVHVGLYSTFFDNRIALSPDLIVKSDDEYIVAPGVYWHLEPRNNALVESIGFGVRAYFADFEYKGSDREVEAIAIGTMGRSRQLTENYPFYLAAGIHFAPHDLTYSDGRKLWAWFTNLEYEVMDDFFLYLGYRSIRADIKQGDDVEIDQTANLGFRLAF